MVDIGMVYTRNKMEDIDLVYLKENIDTGQVDTSINTVGIGLVYK